jgi:energy-coupling factor transporter ATP-binding protein EcfA2
LPPDAALRRRPTLEQVAADADLPVVDWDAVSDEFIGSIEQGQHIVTLGKTGLGKSTFSFVVANGLWERRGASVAAFITKKEDRTSAEQGWIRLGEWPPSFAQRRMPPPGRPRGSESTRVLVWPSYTKASTYARDRAPVFLRAIDEIMEEGGWVLYLDEASYLVQSMRLRTSLDELFTQARSNGITLIAGSQRPVWVSRGEVSQHTWIAAFKIGDSDDANRAGEVLGDRKRFAPVIPLLEPHQILLINSTTGEGVITMVKKPR